MKSPRLAGALALGLFAVACDDTSHHDPDGGVAPVPVEDRPQRHLTDAQGRSLILRGMNIQSASKSAPDRSPDVTEAELTHIATEGGFRFVRHLIFWGAIEPTQGTFDEAYLDLVESWLDRYQAHGMKVLLDMHQDIFSDAPSWGNGAPAWAVSVALDGTIPTIPPQSIWSNAYYTAPVTQAFDRFFGYEGDYRVLQDRYAAAWRRVAERFRDHPAVIGYDVMNEPFPGSAWDPLEVGISQFESSPTYDFDRNQFAAFYQRMINAIREVDPDTFVFYEPRFGAPGNGSRSYLPRLDDPREGEDHLGYAPHMYSVGYEANGSYSPGSDRSVDRFEAARGYEIREHDVPLIIGEWGLEQSHPGGIALTDREADAWDRLNASWAYWSLDIGTTPSQGWTPYYRTGDPQAPLADQPNSDVLVRVYPMATAGYLRSFQWTRSTRTFTMTFDSIDGVTGVVPTEIFLPDERFFPNGFAVSIGGPDPSFVSQSFDDANNVLTVNVDTVSRRHVLSIVPLDYVP